MTTTTHELPKLVSFPDAMRALGIGVTTGDRLLRNSSCDLPRPFWIGGRRYFIANDLTTYIERKAAAARGEQAA